jgi:hypothetical protein
MARGTKRVKVDRDSTAAYGASQPLFDALRLAVNRTSEQHVHLSDARDVVQQTHVKLAESISDGDSSQHTRYIDCAIKAWRSATASYADIFNALAKASAAEPGEGKPMREGHELFVKMAGVAADANSMAKSFVLCEEKQNGQPDHIGQNAATNEESENESDAHSDGNVHHGDVYEDTHDTAVDSMSNQPTLKRGRQQAKPGALQDLKLNGKGSKFKKRVEEARNKHEKKLLALRAKMRQAQGGQATSEKAHQQAPTIPGAGTVEYEDVSEEVHARLKARQAKREAAKKEKKRKRDSGDSYGVDLREDEGVYEKPAKKRTKSNGPGNEVAIVAVKEKRQKHGREVDDGDGGRMNKRAKMKV